MIRIFLLAGQSNMVGAGITAQIPTAQRKPLENLLLFEDGAWRDLLWRDRFGPEVGLSEPLSSAFPDDRIVLLKIARSGANLYYDWNPDGVFIGPEDEYRGPLYPEFTDTLGRLKAQLSSSGEIVECSGLMWMQGERDSVFEFMAVSYEKNLTNFINAVRRDTGNENLPFVMGQIAPRVYRLEEGQFQHAYRHVVQKAQHAVAHSNRLVELAESMDLPQSDNLHFDTGGQLELGRRFAEAYLKARIAG